MGVSIIPNQPIAFHLADEINCDCNTQPFCQIIAPTDPTQFQLSSSNEVVNGDFAAELEGWVVQEALVFDYIWGNITETGLCDGYITIAPINGASPYVFTLDGVSNSTGTFNDLCEGCYSVSVIDDDGVEGSIELCIYLNVVCGDYTNTIDFVDVETVELANCNTIDFV